MSLRYLALLAVGTLPALIFSGAALGAAEAALCSQATFSTVPGAPPAPKAAKPNLGEEKQELDEKVFVDADQANMTQVGVSQLNGGVRVRQGDKEFVSQSLNYDDSQRLITIDTESVFSNPSLIIRSQSSRFDLNDDSGLFGEADFVLPVSSGRGTSTNIAVAKSGVADMQHALFTTCPINSNAWYIEAKDIEFDQSAGQGTARDAKLLFEGVPILWLPKMTFPLDDRRESGFLFPTVGNSTKTGFDARIPYYLNLAPNYDATITPREMVKRGLQMGTSGRYLLDNGEGTASFDYLNDDKEYGASRSLARFDHVNLFTPELGLEATYARASDDQYFQDLGTTFASSSISNLERSARLTYQAPASYRIIAQVQDFQTINNGLVAVQNPYKRLPDIHFDALTSNSFLDTRAGLNAEYVDFVHGGQMVEGQRIDAQPYLRFLHDRNAWYVTSQVDWHYTAYELTNTQYSAEADQPKTPTRSLPVVSGETGLRFDRITDSGAIQTLEPRLFALYVPYRNQDDLPAFDTGIPDFDFTQLFARNRFFGEDRISDAENLTGAVTTRVIDSDTGDMIWSASVGQIYRLIDSKVTLPGVEAPESGAADFVAEVAYNFNKQWSAASAGQWSPENDELVRSNVSLRYRDPSTGSRFDVAYRDRVGLLKQTDLSFDLPVNDEWRVGGRSTYSIRDSKVVQNLFGVTYENCCFALSGAYREYIASANGNLNNGVYFQLELKGLSRIGTGFATLLPSDNGDSVSSPGALGSIGSADVNGAGSRSH